MQLEMYHLVLVGIAKAFDVVIGIVSTTYNTYTLSRPPLQDILRTLFENKLQMFLTLILSDTE